MMLIGFVAVAIVQVVHGDLYMHCPRGSNNRLKEQSANRQNANRLYDTQNNNRGGYNVGDLHQEDGFNGSGDTNGNGPTNDRNVYNLMYNMNEDVANNNDNGARIQYNMMFMEGSLLRMTWTAQHGCGNAKNNCNFVIQWACDTEEYSDGNNFAAKEHKATGLRMQLRNGAVTTTPNDPNNIGNIAQTYQNNNNNNGNNLRGRHESEEYYYYAKKRERNKGLFTADQNLKGNTQIYTRQNPNGARRGLEVPEERDYYPWPRPSPFHDVAWIGNDVAYCNQEIAPESQNVKGKWTCVGKNGNNPNLDALPTDQQIEALTEEACTAADGAWIETRWGVGEDNQPECVRAQWSQVNNHGNVDGTTKGGQMASYNMWLPKLTSITNPTGSLNAPSCYEYDANDMGINREAAANDVKFTRFIVRNRYNMSTMDYDPYLTDSNYNQNLKDGVISPIQQNPTVDTGAHMQGLRLAINTAQTGRVFQDRSHVGTLMSFPGTTSGPLRLAKKEGNLLNVVVRGKRGNIVQTYPAVEYDFEPNDFEMEVDQCIHFQWTGSNTHNNGNPAGDGQAGDAGEGRGGSDRSNLAELKTLKSAYPLPYDKFEHTFFDDSDCTWPLVDKEITPQDAKIIMASGGYYTGEEDIQADNKENLDPLLNNVSASMRGGIICCAKRPGEHYMVSTRNNNFTNRSQKLHIVVKNKNLATLPKDKWKFFPSRSTSTANTAVTCTETDECSRQTTRRV